MEDHIKRKRFDAEHFLRLEWESQFLRKQYPFFIPQKEEIKKEFSMYSENIDKEAVNKSCKEQLESIGFQNNDVQRLLEEAKSLDNATISCKV